MADKSLFHFIVDQGTHMSQVTNGSYSNDLQYGLQYPISLVTSKILRKRKTEYVSLMTVDGTDEGNTGQDNVSLLFSFKQTFYCDLKDFKLDPAPPEADPDGAGIIRALLYSIDIMQQFVLKKKIKRNVVMVTNSQKEPELQDMDYINAIVENVLNFSIDLTLIGVDFDSPKANQDNIKLWKLLFEALPSTSCRILTGYESIELINNPEVKAVRPVAVFKGPFRIGANLQDGLFDSRNDLSCISFDTEAYKAVMSSKNEYSLKAYGKSEKEGDIFPLVESVDYTIRHYKDSNIDPESDEEGEELEYETELIDKSKIKKSYKYGSNSIMLPSELESLTKLSSHSHSPHGLDLRGVVPALNFPKAYLTGESIYLVPAKNSEQDAYSMYALVDSLQAMQCYGIARYVAKSEADPQMVVLIPCFVSRDEVLKRKSSESSNEDVRCLLMCRLPFFEDVKIPILPALNMVKDSQGEKIPVKNESETQLQADQVQDLMDDLVKNWDITFEEDKNTYKYGKLYANVNHDLVHRGSFQSIQNTRWNHMIREIAIAGFNSPSLLDYSLNSKSLIPKLPSVIKDQITVTDQEALDKIDQLSKLLNVKKFDKNETVHRRGKRRNFNDDVEVEEKFDEWSLEELLEKGGF